MTEILLKRELEPLARQRQRYKLLVALAVAWGGVAVIAFAVFTTRKRSACDMSPRRFEITHENSTSSVTAWPWVRATWP